MAKLIVIRGNSGSGKSTLALSLREELNKKGVKSALVSQDYFRRIVLKEKNRIDQTDIIKLLDANVRILIKLGYVVILEGILSSKKYGPMLIKFDEDFGKHSCRFFYYDVSFEETLKRHKTKSNAHEFGEEEMREWWIHKDRLNLSNEFVIGEALEIPEARDLVLKEIGKN